MSRYRARHRSRAGAVRVLVLGLVAAALAVLVPGAYGGYIARVTNDTVNAATAPYFTCTAAAQGESGTKAQFAWPFSDGALALTAADVSGNNYGGTYTLLGVTRGVANTGSSAVCPRDNRTVATFDGSTGYVYPTSATAAAGPTAFSVEVWFRTTSAQGRLIGFSGSRTGTSSNYDRHLYVNTSGNLVFGVYPNAVVTVASPGQVTDGAWHHAVGTVSGAGMFLYLDGKQVASSPNTGVQSFSGYWRVGYDSLANWPGGGSGYFRGSLAYAAVYGYALTAAQVQTHFVAGD
ncbi:LamG domain-containing protein [Jatrophihabitans fulvus]